MKTPYPTSFCFRSLRDFSAPRYELLYDWNLYGPENALTPEIRLEIISVHGGLTPLEEVIISNGFSNTWCKSSASLTKRWINDCRASRGHKRCHHGPTSWLPSRLIHIGTKRSPKVRLRKSRRVPPGSQYITLSHCWGDREIYSLTQQNQDALMRKIDYSRLPQTFRDAICVARELDVEYLWIDSLCILQDCESDWLAESVEMGKVYANGVCNIAATSAKDGRDGLFRKRNPVAFLPVLVTANSPSSTCGKAQVATRSSEAARSNRGKLSYAKDKLIAVHGIATRMNTNKQGRYIAGLWEEILPELLLWRVSEPATRPDVHQAPSWSWAAVNGTVEQAITWGIWQQDHKFVATVERVHQISPLGTIIKVEAVLQVRGALFPATLVPSEASTILPKPERTFVLQIHGTRCKGTLYLDHANIEPTAKLYALPFLTYNSYSNPLKPTPDTAILKVEGLLLHPIEGNKGRYQRTGMFESIISATEGLPLLECREAPEIETDLFTHFYKASLEPYSFRII
ncbi:MAG: hypothetical protein Q9167_000806 [Letrouitia subvulpina]